MQLTDSNDPLILVDDQDREIGQLDKLSCHDGQGQRHRAFSVWVQRANGDLLLQQRAPEKRLWGGFWSNTCCSHPIVGENTEDAVHRRLQQELNLAVEALTWLYSFNYQASFGEAGSENEHCHVYWAKGVAEPKPHPGEISAIRWLSPSELDAEVQANFNLWTPWFKLEWQTIKQKHYKI